MQNSQDSNNNLHVILASQSPRRRELLNLVGIGHEVIPANIDESMHTDETHYDHVVRLAREKASALAKEYPNALVIGADTIVVLDGSLLDKPKSEAEANATLMLLSGKTHTVHTAVAVCRNGKVYSDVESVKVKFRTITEATIRAYLSTGEPMDKAGAYGIQGYGATIVERIEGDYFAVMGLPLGMLVQLCSKAGAQYSFGNLLAG